MNDSPTSIDQPLLQGQLKHDHVVEVIRLKIENLGFKGNCKRILLVAPPQVPEEDFDVEVALDKRYPVFSPYGIGIINRRLLEHGYISQIVDLNFEVMFALSENPDSFRYSVWKEKLSSTIKDFNPDIVGITCMFTMTGPQMYEVADFIKTVDSNLPIIVGGVHASAASKTVLDESQSIDFVSLYEGDSSFHAFLEFINGKVSQEAIRQIATVYEGNYYCLDRREREQDIDTSPEFGQLPIGKYHTLGKIGAYNFLLPEDTRASTILSNRGCRGRCAFCSVNAFYKKRVTKRSVAAVVNEMELLVRRYRISHFMWLDDDLLYDENTTLDLFMEIQKRQLGITWDASNGVIASAITPEIADAAYKSGCIGLHLGIESGNSDILRSVRKPSNVEHFRRAAQILKDYPEIFVKGFLMVGFKNETIGQVLDTVNLAQQLRLDWYPIQILSVFPSTEIHQNLVKEGSIREKDFSSKFFIGSTGGQRLREARERIEAAEFINLLEADTNMVPNEHQIKDLWFLIDYKVNYERIFSEDRVVKLQMLSKMLVEVCNRVKENPLATLFLGIVEEKLGNREKCQELKSLAEIYLNESAFWQKRFDALNLNEHIGA